MQEGVFLSGPEASEDRNGRWMDVCRVVLYLVEYMVVLRTPSRDGNLEIRRQNINRERQYQAHISTDS